MGPTRPQVTINGEGHRAWSGTAIRPARVHDQLEPATSAQFDGAEVANVASGETVDAKLLGQRDDRSIHQTQTMARIPTVNLHGALQQPRGRGRVREGASQEVSHESAHGAALFAKEVINLGEHQARDVARSGVIDCFAKSGVIRRPQHEVVQQSAGVAEQGG